MFSAFCAGCCSRMPRNETRRLVALQMLTHNVAQQPARARGFTAAWVYFHLRPLRVLPSLPFTLYTRCCALYLRHACALPVPRRLPSAA